MSATQIIDSITALGGQRLGFQAISLSEMTTSAATVILAGSKCEVAGALFGFVSDTTPNASSWTAIATANTAYLTAVPSGTAGSQILSLDWTATAPEWHTARQGWYTSAGSIIRHIGGCTKGGATSYDYKFGLDNSMGRSLTSPYVATSGTIIQIVTRDIYFEIGSWDMDLTNFVDVSAPSMANEDMLDLSVSIISDNADTSIFTHIDNADIAAYFPSLSAFRLQRKTGGTYDSVTYDDTSINRGYVHATVRVV